MVFKIQKILRRPTPGLVAAILCFSSFQAAQAWNILVTATVTAPTGSGSGTANDPVVVCTGTTVAGTFTASEQNTGDFDVKKECNWQSITWAWQPPAGGTSASTNRSQVFTSSGTLSATVAGTAHFSKKDPNSAFPCADETQSQTGNIFVKVVNNSSWTTLHTAAPSWGTPPPSEPYDTTYLTWTGAGPYSYEVHAFGSVIFVKEEEVGDWSGSSSCGATVTETYSYTWGGDWSIDLGITDYATITVPLGGVSTTHSATWSWTGRPNIAVRDRPVKPIWDAKDSRGAWTYTQEVHGVTTGVVTSDPVTVIDLNQTHDADGPTDYDVQGMCCG